MITVTVDTTALDRVIADFPERYAAAKTRALNDIGATVKERATAAFRTPSFRPTEWTPRKSGGSHPLLIKSGALRQSLSWRLDGADAVVVGSSQKYAPYHQFGTKRMDARPFFPIDKYGNIVPRVLEKINKKVAKAFSEELGNLGTK